MSVVVFLGPSLPVADARAALDATYLPPAAQGDVYRAARRRPAAIGIVDGYFDTLPAVWHKEILWAMREGIAVFGAASMGALRAAELEAFGMRGVGTIFDAYRSGALEDDDEVALAHEPAERGYRALSVPMVSIRATLARATDAGVLSSAARDAMLAIAKGLFYPERTYKRMLAEAPRASLPAAEVERFVAWLPHGQVDAKRADALAMLAAMGEHVSRGDAPPEARYRFEHTTYFERLRHTVESGPAAEGGEALDEARLDPATWERVRLRAEHRAMARALAEQRGRQPDEERLARAAADFRRRHGLEDEAALRGWLAARAMSAADFARLVEDEAIAAWAASIAGAGALLGDAARREDAYPEWHARARKKSALLADAGLAEPSPADAGMTREEIVAWFFREVLRAPGDGDARAAWGDADESLVRVALREFLYRRKVGLLP